MTLSLFVLCLFINKARLLFFRIRSFKGSFTNKAPTNVDPSVQGTVLISPRAIPEGCSGPARISTGKNKPTRQQTEQLRHKPTTENQTANLPPTTNNPPGRGQETTPGVASAGRWSPRLSVGLHRVTATRQIVILYRASRRNVDLPPTA